MKTIGFDKPLYILPFDHRGSFQTKMFGWKGTLTSDQTAQIAAAKQVIYDAFQAALESGVPTAPPVRPKKAGRTSSISNMATTLLNTSSHFVPRSVRFWCAITRKPIVP
jgi:hypothetical protein